MEFYVGQKVFRMPRFSSSKMPQKRTVEKVNQRFVTLDTGEKYNARTGRTWGEDYYRASYRLEPWTAELEAKLKTQAEFDASIGRTKLLLDYIDQHRNRMRFDDLAVAQRAEAAMKQLYATLVELNVIPALNDYRGS